MLTLAEEVLLLSHDDERGQFLDLPDMMLHTALAGAVLMELAMLDRIDTDLQRLTLVSAEPTGEPLLDATLAQVANEPEARSTASWLDRLRGEGPRIRAEAIARLIERGVLRQEHSGWFWGLGSGRYLWLGGRRRGGGRLGVAN